MTDVAERIAQAFVAACRDELQALKPGNVHVFADGHGMTANDFVRSAAVAAGPLTQPGAKVGARILGAVQATHAAVATNTNLGIILLCAPLAAAAENGPADLRVAVARVLADLDIEDAEFAFRAITLASPGGLGTAARHAVRAPATVSLRTAMAGAAAGDRIARQYVTDFEDVFVTGADALAGACRRGRDRAAMEVFLAFLAAFPDSHIVRKHGPLKAEEVRRLALNLCAQLPAAQPAQLMDRLLDWDRQLKRNGINPGTSADLTVATLFAAHLQDGLPSRRNSD